ncbi:MAG: beta-propeller fold lactonase family protein [Planctomycetota bacterium]
MKPPHRTPLASALVAGIAAIASAQSIDPIVIVANNGNVEGSISSLRVEADGSLTFIDRVVTGDLAVDNPCIGCNAFRVSLSPDGQFAATVHATGGTFERIAVTRVNADGTLDIVEEIFASFLGTDVQWITDDVLAIILSTDQLELLTWDGIELGPGSSAFAGTFFNDMAIHPNRRWLYCNDSSSFTVRVFDIDPGDGPGGGPTATLVQTLGIPVFGSSLIVDPTGRYLYAAGGTAAGGNAIAGFTIDQVDGSLSLIPGPGPSNTFVSPGEFPKNFAFVSDTLLYAGHGGDATVQAFDVDPDTGAIAATGASFDIGGRGTLRELDAGSGRLFAIDGEDLFDNLEGVYSFSIDNSSTPGTLVPALGAPTPTQGIDPEDLEYWPGLGPQPCTIADLAVPFGFIDLSDVDAFIAAFNTGDPLADVAFPFGVVDLSDIDAFIAAFIAGCP